MKRNSILKFICLVILGAGLMSMVLNWKDFMRGARDGYKEGKASVSTSAKP